MTGKKLPLACCKEHLGVYKGALSEVTWALSTQKCQLFCPGAVVVNVLCIFIIINIIIYLFNDAFNFSNCVAWNDRMINEQQIGKDAEENGRGLI
jgi:hypothetical protein